MRTANVGLLLFLLCPAVIHVNVSVRLPVLFCFDQSQRSFHRHTRVPATATLARRLRILFRTRAPSQLHLAAAARPAPVEAPFRASASQHAVRVVDSNPPALAQLVRFVALVVVGVF